MSEEIEIDPGIRTSSLLAAQRVTIEPPGGGQVLHEESEVKKAIVEVSKRVIALTPTERINTAEAFFICPLESVDTIITDEGGKELAEQYFKDSGITVM